MIAPTEMVVQLRGELGNQHILANRKLEAIEVTQEYPRKDRDLQQVEGRIARIVKATEALGGLNLGDIVDVYNLPNNAEERYEEREQKRSQ